MSIVTFLATQTMLSLQAHMNCRFNFFVEQISNVIFYACTTCAVAIIVWRFSDIGGFGPAEILLIYSLALVSYFLAGIYFWGVSRTLEMLIRSGELDLVLLKPIPPLLFLMVRSFDPSMLIKSVGAFGLCLYSLSTLDVTIGVSHLAWLAAVILGGTLIQCGIMLGFSSIGFWISGSRDLVELLIYSVRRFIDFPIVVYPVAIQVVLTTFIPYAFVNFYPVSGLVSETKDAGSLALMMSPLLVGIPVTLAGYGIWRLGLRRYARSGA